MDVIVIGVSLGWPWYWIFVFDYLLFEPQNYIKNLQLKSKINLKNKENDKRKTKKYMERNNRQWAKEKKLNWMTQFGLLKIVHVRNLSVAYTP